MPTPMRFVVIDRDVFAITPEGAVRAHDLEGVEVSDL
jgi:hypothetical protein